VMCLDEGCNLGACSFLETRICPRTDGRATFLKLKCLKQARPRSRAACPMDVIPWIQLYNNAGHLSPEEEVNCFLLAWVIPGIRLKRPLFQPRSTNSQVFSDSHTPHGLRDQFPRSISSFNPFDLPLNVISYSTSFQDRPQLNFVSRSICCHYIATRETASGLVLRVASRSSHR
jgi:hypothetical protein